MADAFPAETAPETVLLAVLPLRDQCLFPETTLALLVGAPGTLLALQIARRAGARVLAVGLREAGGPADLHEVGTVARVIEDLPLQDGSHRVELEGLQRARTRHVAGVETLLAEAEPLRDGDPSGEEWGAAVEALARYLHGHAELRSFLNGQRRSADPMAWVNLACQHLPISPTARQRLLEADAAARCVKIGRGLEALLRKEHGA